MCATGDDFGCHRETTDQKSDIISGDETPRRTAFAIPSCYTTVGHGQLSRNKDGAFFFILPSLLGRQPTSTAKPAVHMSRNACLPHQPILPIEALTQLSARADRHGEVGRSPALGGSARPMLVLMPHRQDSDDHRMLLQGLLDLVLKLAIDPLTSPFIN